MLATSKGRRLAALRISGELLQDLFVTTPDGKWFRIDNGIPSDAVFVRMTLDTSYGRNELFVVYEHPSFPLTMPGYDVPTMNSPLVSWMEHPGVPKQTTPSDDDQPTCLICGYPMPPGEEMFYYHGYSGPCPTSPPLSTILPNLPYLPNTDLPDTPVIIGD